MEASKNSSSLEQDILRGSQRSSPHVNVTLRSSQQRSSWLAPCFEALPSLTEFRYPSAPRCYQPTRVGAKREQFTSRFWRCVLGVAGLLILGICNFMPRQTRHPEEASGMILWSPALVVQWRVAELWKPRDPLGGLSGVSRKARNKVEGLSGLSEESGGAALVERRNLMSRKSKEVSHTGWPQVDALLAFKARVYKGSEVVKTWTVPPQSKNPEFVCTWEGVTCSFDHKNIEGFLFSEALVGIQGATWPQDSTLAFPPIIPPEFGNLTALTLLEIKSTAFFNGFRFAGLQGPIPTELTKLKNLKIIRLPGNGLQGQIPQTLSALPNLEELTLDSNFLEADRLDFLCSFTKLTKLSFHTNNIAGTIPDCFSHLTALTELALVYMPISGSLPASLGNMRGLQYLGCGYAPYLQGSLPTSLSLLSALTSLNLHFCNISGTLPGAPTWQALDSLKEVKIEACPLNGTLPQSLGRNLAYIRIHRTNMTGPILPSFARSLARSNLGFLELSSNKFFGSLPAELSNCTSLSRLDLPSNNFSGPIPPGFFEGFGGSLNYLQLNDNQFEGTLPSNLLSMLRNMWTINLSNNRFTGPAPWIMSPRGHLSRFQIAGNQFTGDVARVLRDLPNKNQEILDLSDNLLSGTLPPNWVRNAQTLLMERNNITGPIPTPTLAQLSAITRLSLSGNKLSGPIPHTLLQNCTTLSFLNLSHNNLSGQIPDFGKELTMASVDLSGNRLNGSFPASIENTGNLRVLNLSRNAISGAIPASISRLSALVSSLDLSSNSFSGPIPPPVGNLENLKFLSVAQNNLSGSIPGELAPPFFPNISTLNLSHNLLSGPIPYSFSNVSTSLHLDLSSNNLSSAVPLPDQGVSFFAANPGSIANNPNLCGLAGYPDCPVRSSSAPTMSPGEIAAITIGTALFLAIMLGILYRFLPGESSPWKGGVFMAFHNKGEELTLQAILTSTEMFDEKYLLGEGGFGSVYKGELEDGAFVAIKRLKAGSAQGEEEFRSEVQILGTLFHRNLTPLLGAYISPTAFRERLLVYQYISGGSLDNYLVPNMPETSPLKHFEVRLRIATDVARALKYLHHDCQPGIIHRDMKPANVLLDEDLNAYLADFGLAKEAGLGRSHMTADGVVGTVGFVAPEYSTLRHMSFKSDVYAYGVTLIQLMSGRNTTERGIVEKGLQRWALVEGAGVVDPNLIIADEMKLKRVVAAVKVGIMCIARVPVDRPDMEEVLELLNNLDELATTMT